MGNLVNWPPSWSTLLLIPALLVGFTVHELAHALVAFLLGDTSQVERKRLSFNPLRHVSWVGMIAFLLVGFGWAKPVWVDQSRLRIRNQAFGVFLVSIAGASANLITALLVLFGVMATVTVVWTATGASPFDIMQFLIAEEPGPGTQGFVVAFTYYMIMVNLLLAFFNLLPLPPLDGFRALMSLAGMFRGQRRTDSWPEPAGLPASHVAVDESSPDSPAQIHFNIGLAYHREGQLDEAIARYRQALAHDENLSLAYYNQGLAYWAKERLPLARSAFVAVVQGNGDPDVQMQAGLRLRELSRFAENPSAGLGPAPPPLGPGELVVLPGEVAPALDPAVARRVWLRLGVGGIAALACALAIWLFVTAATLAGVG
jgi:Zn-dependent protease